MKIAIGGDHAGYELKTQLIPLIEDLGHEVLDCGTDSTKAVDYPDFSRAVGEAVRDGRVERGIVVCGSGIGANIAANKIHGVRAGQSSETYSAHQGVEHDDMNVLVLASRVIGPAVAQEIVEAFLSAKFSGEERHVRRLKKVMEIEAEN
ncbi:ribose 5-phosphate isomerase B [Abditibacterium utsteinense]|uniref:Ribose 5-phosphate isomerase B n=1 Tax=Abditibacterium utsteinense TaxID=1960156 RepID=A0A2S8SUM6_9BACT|nr:ribose 5-phosphate isomerase B [Abditibacterium utsteinense]PQV64501.1 ribose 5-phosphate isomerase B [Abditibacterium utsteinense]